MQGLGSADGVWEILLRKQFILVLGRGRIAAQLLSSTKSLKVAYGLIAQSYMLPLPPFPSIYEHGGCVP